MARLSRPSRSVGISDAREGAGWLYHEVVPVSQSEQAVRRYLKALERFGVPQVNKPSFPLPPGVPLNPPLPDRPCIVFHPFARGEGKSLSFKQVKEFCTALRPLKVILAGMGTVHQDLPDNTTNLLSQTTLRQMIWLLGAAEFVVSVDSGSMHIAAATNPRMLSIHT
jgi:ADP-heptose:LPS heptosyltransferase